MTYSSVSNNLNKLEYKNHVIRDDKVYKISPMTKLYFSQLRDLKKALM